MHHKIFQLPLASTSTNSSQLPVLSCCLSLLNLVERIGLISPEHDNHISKTTRLN